MAEYIVVEKNNELGRIAINKSVIASIVELSIQEVENAVVIPSTRLKRPITIKVEKGALSVFIEMNLKFGANVNATCELVQNKAYENIQFMTGLKPKEIMITVANFEN
ncbi:MULTISPECIES: Asp23/Gls24 family envelope stress response protein [Terrabacteria group]|uniref:Asp23/Gls24 family envelope stress response protein n=1 Tax=Bacillati TaxID=1783272 RepID=UPI001C6E76E9|nr:MULTISPECIES: Asp23/Gls24 family envelope stress response protein [Terrabacteria group]MBW9211869.1 Asp23/Gls24 family envelope stress response protein [Trueperella sp. zg.1013]